MRHFSFAGFTVIELMITISILSILTAVALPNLNTFFEKRRLIAASEAMYAHLQLARSYAIATSADIYVDFEIDGGENWQATISQFSGCDPDAGMTESNACYVVIDNGDGSIDSNDYVHYQLDSVEYPGIRVTNVTFGSDEAKFKVPRGTAKAGSVKLESESGYRIKVVVGLLGRVRMCSPSGSSHVNGYASSSCSW